MALQCGFLYSPMCVVCFAAGAYGVEGVANGGGRGRGRGRGRGTYTGSSSAVEVFFVFHVFLGWWDVGGGGGGASIESVCISHQVFFES